MHDIELYFPKYLSDRANARQISLTPTATGPRLRNSDHTPIGEHLTGVQEVYRLLSLYSGEDLLILQYIIASAMCHVPCAMCHVPCAMCHVPCLVNYYYEPIMLHRAHQLIRSSSPCCIKISHIPNPERRYHMSDVRDRPIVVESNGHLPLVPSSAILNWITLKQPEVNMKSEREWV